MKRTFVTACVMIGVLFTANIVLSQSNIDYKPKIESLNKEMAKNMLEGNTEKLLSRTPMMRFPCQVISL